MLHRTAAFGLTWLGIAPTPSVLNGNRVPYLVSHLLFGQGRGAGRLLCMCVEYAHHVHLISMSIATALICLRRAGVGGLVPGCVQCTGPPRNRSGCRRDGALIKTDLSIDVQLMGW